MILFSYFNGNGPRLPACREKIKMTLKVMRIFVREDFFRKKPGTS
jgi:hypothetical protein